MSRQDPGAAHEAIPTPPLPGCANCPHSAYVHAPKGGKRTSCSSWHGGRCKCKQYVPEEG